MNNHFFSKDKYLPRKHWDTYGEDGSLIEKEMVFFYDMDNQGRGLDKKWNKRNGCQVGRFRKDDIG